MGEGKVYHSHKKQYFIIFGVLTVLTILELMIPGLDTSTMMKGSGLTILAFAKAFVVAYWYMHLNEETKWTKFIAAIPLSAAAYAAVVILESLYR